MVSTEPCASSTSCVKSRLLSGRFSICSRTMVLSTDRVWVSSGAASAETVTVWSSEPTFNETLRTTVSATSMRMLSQVSVWKPVICAVIRYMPGGSG